MTFFPADPAASEPDEPEQQNPRWWGAPGDELPGIIPVSAVLARSEHVVMMLVGVHVYRDGVELRLERRLRRGKLISSDWDALTNRFMEMQMGTQSGEGRLRHGLVLADGERVIEGHFGMPGLDPMTRPEGYSLMRNGGGGGGGNHSRATSEQLWIWPLPPAGVTELVVQWPEMGIPESRHRVDLSQLGDLVAATTPLWGDAAAE